MARRTVTPAQYLRNTLMELKPDFLRSMIEVMTRVLMEIEVSEQIGAGRYERSESRQDYRNGYRDPVWDTRVGEIPLQIPKLRHGSYCPSFLEPRRRAERALMAVIQSAYVEGVRTRKVHDLVQAFGPTGTDKSKVSHIRKELSEVVPTSPEPRLRRLVLPELIMRHQVYPLDETSVIDQ
ncbi:MAG: transposase [Anaerolineae bacterium]|jgi:transposase-like protein